MYTWISGTPGYQVRCDIRYAWISGTPGYQVRLDFMYTWISGTPGYPEHLDIMYTWISGIRLDISYAWILVMPGYQVCLNIRYAWISGTPGYQVPRLFLLILPCHLFRSLSVETEFVSEFDSSRSLIHSLLEQQGKAPREKKGGGELFREK